MSEALPKEIKYLGLSLIVALMLIAGSFGALVASKSKRAKMVIEPPAPTVGPMQPLEYFEDVAFPDFDGVSHVSEAVDASVLDGEVTVVDFIFTHCPLICPIVSTRMMEQNAALEGTGVRFLSISVDPEHDTPEVLAEFAGRYDADPDRWLFVRTPMEQVDAIGEAMGFAIQENENDQVPISADETMANIIHPTELLLIGPDRRVYGRYHYRIPEDLAQLTKDARRLREESR